MKRAWSQLLANLGDANPIDHGGFFVFETERDGSRPQAEILEVTESHEQASEWTIYRFDLDQCTYVDGILSDNQFHPDYAVWFADDLPHLAESIGLTTEELAAQFCSENPIERALAYREVVAYRGPYEFDQYPLTITSRNEVTQRYYSALRSLARRQAAARNN